MTSNKTKRLVGIAMLAALAYLISILSFPILPGVSFLKVDFSDLPILFGMYIYGPLSGVAIAFIRSLLSYAQTGGEAGFPIGDSTAFLASLALNLPIYYVIQRGKLDLKSKVLAGAVATVTLTAVMAFVNWLYVLPAYLTVMGFDVGPMREYMLFALVPFNFIKGPLVTFVIFLAFAKLKPFLDKARKKSGLAQRDFSYEN